MSMASARGTPSVSAASASTPDPVPTSSTDRGRTISTVSSSASRHSAVVGCSPVPNDGASINLTAPGRISWSAGTMWRRPTRTWRGLRIQTESASRPIAVEIRRSSTPSALAACPGVTPSGSRAATVPSPSNSTSSAPARRADRGVVGCIAQIDSIRHCALRIARPTKVATGSTSLNKRQLRAQQVRLTTSCTATATGSPSPLPRLS